MICPHCQAWIAPIPHHTDGTLSCPLCNQHWSHTFPPLFILTGPSGTGKTALVEPLQNLLPEWEVFETDILWDSDGDWQMVKCNWVRIAASLAMRPHQRNTLLCGTINLAEIESCPQRVLFGNIYWITLLCTQDKLRQRLTERPQWRGCDEEFIEHQSQFLAILQEQAKSSESTNSLYLDTTTETLDRTANHIVSWLRERE